MAKQSLPEARRAALEQAGYTVAQKDPPKPGRQRAAARARAAKLGLKMPPKLDMPHPAGEARRAQGMARRYVEKQASTAILVRELFVDAAPSVTRHMVNIALGRVVGASATNQIEAGKVVLTYAGIQGAMPNGGAAKPLSDCSLAELEEVLTQQLDQIRLVRAIPGESEQLKD